MLFSIIVPVYRVEEYIGKCIESICSQTLSDWELILIDDGSPDACPRICDEYAAKDARIRVIHQKNSGVSAARNAGMRSAAGEYVLFVDSDDYLEPDACARLAEAVKSKCDVVVADAIVEGDKGYLAHIEPSDTIYSGYEYLEKALRQERAPMAVWLNAYRRVFLIENDLFFKTGILHEDEQFTPRVLLCAKSVRVTGILFYHYVVRMDSITTRMDKRKNAEDIYSTCCELEQIYRTVPNEELRRRLLDSLCGKYLDIFQQGRLYQYGNAYTHKDMIRRNAFSGRNRKKAALFCFSPRIYYFCNRITKILTRA